MSAPWLCVVNSSRGDNVMKLRDRRSKANDSIRSRIATCIRGQIHLASVQQLTNPHLFKRLFVPGFIGLECDCPLKKFENSIAELPFGLETNQRFSARQIGLSVPDIALAKCTVDSDLGFFAKETVHDSGHFQNGCTLARAHVEDMSAAHWALDTRCGSLNDVVNVNEIPAFESILENIDLAPCPRQIREDCQDSGVRILQRLA